MLTSPFHASQAHHQQSEGGERGITVYLKSDGSVEGEGDTPALVVLVHVELENVSLTVGPPGGCLHPGADCGLAPGPGNQNTYRQ